MVFFSKVLKNIVSRGPPVYKLPFFFQLKLNEQSFAMLKQRPLLTKLTVKNGKLKKTRIVIIATAESIDKKETNILMEALEAIMDGYSM